MSDYISREAAIEDFEYCTQENSTWTPQRVKTLLMRIPAADAVPVVRCRDCTHYNGHRHCDYFCEAMLDDDFCSYGKARETPINLAPLSQEERWLKTI